jgi:hypothetical protein
MDSMRRNAQKMMPHVMALNKNPTMGMKNDRQPKPGVSNLTAYAKGGMVKSDAKQDKSMLARHNKLMHPGQKSKLKNGGMVKKYVLGGKAIFDKGTSAEEETKRVNADYKALLSKSSRPEVPDEISVSGRKVDKIDDKKPSSFGAAFKAARAAQGAGGTFTYNGKKYSTNRADDKPVEKSAPKNIGQDANEEALGYARGGKVKKYADGGPILSPSDKKKAKKGVNPFPGRSGDMGMKKGGKVKNDKKKVMGTVGEAKAVMAALQKARRPATPMPGTRMAGLGMAPPMAPPMKHGGKVMKKAAGGAAKLRRKSPMPDKIKMVNYPRGG